MEILRKKQMDSLYKVHRRLLMTKMELIYGPDKTIDNAVKQLNEAIILIENALYSYDLDRKEP